MDLVTMAMAQAIAKNYTDAQLADLGFTNLSYHFCTTGEYNATSKQPTISSPDANTFYFTPGSTNELFNVYYNKGSGWTKFTTVSVDLSVIPTDDTLSKSGFAADSKTVGDEISHLRDDLNKGYIGVQKMYPQSIKGITGVMQYRTMVLQHKKLAIVSGTRKIIDDPNEDVFIFETGLGWIVGKTIGIYVLNRNDLSYKSTFNSNVVKNLNAIPQDAYYAVNKSELDYLDLDYAHDGMPENTSRDLSIIPITNFSSSAWTSGINAYNGQYKSFAPFKFSGTINTKNTNVIIIFDLDGNYNTHTASNSITVSNKIVAIISSTPDTASITFKSDIKTNIELQEEIEEIKNGNVKSNSLELISLNGVTGVKQYIYGVLKNKTIGVSSGVIKIIDSETDSVYLFEKGLGWIVNTNTYGIIVNASTLEKISNGYNKNIPKNLATIEDGTLYAICKSGFDFLDFDFMHDGMYPYTPKDIKLIPKTLFSTSYFANGINAYNGQYKSFAPFRLNGSVKTDKITGVIYYNDDGSVYGGESVSRNFVSSDNRVIALVSNDIENASFIVSEAEYEYSDEKCSVFGDSLTADAPYYPYLATMTGMQIKNCGIGGTRVSGDATNAFWQNVRINALEGKFIIIMGGSNDCQFATPGTEALTNIDTNTFFGAYNVMLSKIYYRYGINAGYYDQIDYTGVEQIETPMLPNIILVTPPKLFGSENAYNKSGEFAEYVKTIAKWWGLPVVDAWSNMQMSWANESYFFSADDKTHYNTRGRSKLASLIFAKMNECYADFDSQE